MKILLTGAAGFIGFKTGEFLLKDGNEVVGVDNMNNYYSVKLKEWRVNQLVNHEKFVFQKGDIADLEFVKSIFQQHKFDAIINLAARAGVRASVENPWVYIETNVTGTLNLLEAAKDTGVKKFILASTSSLYGLGEMPFREEQDTSKPFSSYAASKKGAEALTYVYHHLYGIDVTVFRYFTVYGPAGRPDMSVFKFTKQIAEGEPITIFGDGNQKRDFTYVDDIAKGTILGLEPLSYEIINLGNDRPVTLNYVIELIEKNLGKKAQRIHKPPHPADLPATWASIEKARKLLGWEPKISIEEGIKRTVEWYLKEREWVSCIQLI